MTTDDAMEWIAGDIGRENVADGGGRDDRDFGGNVGDGIPDWCPWGIELGDVETSDRDISLVIRSRTGSGWGSPM